MASIRYINDTNQWIKMYGGEIWKKDDTCREIQGSGLRCEGAPTGDNGCWGGINNSKSKIVSCPLQVVGSSGDWIKMYGGEIWKKDNICKKIHGSGLKCQGAPTGDNGCWEGINNSKSEVVSCPGSSSDLGSGDVTASATNSTAASLSTGTIIGIIIGVILLLGIIVIGIFIVSKKKKQ